jgi:hypothetical protein
MMSEEEVIEIIKNHFISQFPKRCNCCGKNYKTAEEFVRSTTYVGDPVSYDFALDSTTPSNPLGTVGLVNCSCGSTLAISSKGIGLKTMWKLLKWARAETKKRGISSAELLRYIRNKIDQSLLSQESE